MAFPDGQARDFGRIGDFFLSQRDRWVLWAPVALGLGVGGYFSLAAEPPAWAGGMLLVLLAALLAPFARNRAAVLLWLPFFLAALGFAAAQLRAHAVAAPVLEYRTPAIRLQGRVLSVEALPRGFRFVLGDISPQQVRYSWGKSYPLPSAARITSRIHQPPPEAGATVEVKAKLLPLPPPVLPGAYDFQRAAWFGGFGATGYALGPVTTLSLPRDWRYVCAAVRAVIYRHIAAAIADHDAAAVTAGILIGQRGAISPAAWNDMSRAGLAHLLAVAGLHTGVVTGWIFFFTRLLLASIPYAALRWPVKKIAAAFSIPAALFYLFLVGAPLPAMRAVIMVCAVMTAIILDRDPFSPRLLALAAAVILLLRPESLVGGSFQMSFAAVAVLIAFYEGTRGWWSGLYQDKRWFMRPVLFVLASTATTAAATLGTAPYALYHFLRVPLVAGFLANLLAVPVAVFVVLPVGMVACLLMPFGLDAVPLKIAGYGVKAILAVAAATAHMPYAALHVGGWPLLPLVVITFGGLWTCIWRGSGRWLGLLPVLAGALLIPFAPRADALVSTRANLFAARAADGRLRLLPGRADRFVRNEWGAREGGAGVGAPLACGADACLVSAKGHLVAFAKDAAALPEDCKKADIVAGNFAIPPSACPVALLLDKAALRRTGATALYFNPDGTVTARTVFAARGRRLWTPRVFR
ncbi:MAG: ComEC/Rec2 family competence protein [Alphaproteobacteria bacterium]|nr:ComEC/Rec2 family competence protein [Alphaproteobacteria bacterium]MDE2336936.1 ComEC/Rec2 family competence protein [Alphaproteobacteria bacterium]